MFASEANDLDDDAVLRARELPVHLSGFLEPAAVGGGSGLEARNSIDEVADRVYRRVGCADAKFITIVNDCRLRPACVRLREVESKHIRRANVRKNLIRAYCQLTKPGDVTSVRFSFAFFIDDECSGDLTKLLGLTEYQ